MTPSSQPRRPAGRPDGGRYDTNANASPATTSLLHQPGQVGDEKYSHARAWEEHPADQIDPTTARFVLADIDNGKSLSGASLCLGFGKRIGLEIARRELGTRRMIELIRSVACQDASPAPSQPGDPAHPGA